ncbi:MAG: HigA family addiction module antidote protein [Azoarcus sp.]|jgi:addiction module HigA family antidote|nr:HigA family addiction module antidote protein [Azoarcus sp.]
MSHVENGMRPIHPGEILREEFLLPMNITPHALAIALHVPAPRINDIVRERRAVTADTALRLAQFFGVSVEFWMGLQADYDTARAREALATVLPRIQRFGEAAPA